MTATYPLSRAERVEQFAHDPEQQPLILRLGLNTVGVKGQKRVQYVKDLGYTVARARGEA